MQNSEEPTGNVSDPVKREKIPHGANPSKCRSCGADCYWVKTLKGPHLIDRKQIKLFIPHGDRWVVVHGFSSHFATCPDADKWRSKGNKGQAVQK